MTRCCSWKVDDKQYYLHQQQGAKPPCCWCGLCSRNWLHWAGWVGVCSCFRAWQQSVLSSLQILVWTDSNEIFLSCFPCWEEFSFFTHEETISCFSPWPGFNRNTSLSAIEKFYSFTPTSSPWVDCQDGVEALNSMVASAKFNMHCDNVISMKPHTVWPFYFSFSQCY